MKKFLRILPPILLVVPCLAFAIVILPLYFLLLKVFHAKRLACCIFYSYLRFMVRFLMFTIGGRVHIEGWEELDAADHCYCYIGNHQSMLDIVTLLCPRHFESGFIGKIELRRIPVINLFFAALGSIYIDRKSPKRSIQAILKGSDFLRHGHSMTIFPEGTRSKDGLVHEFKAGSFKMATRAGAAIVPVVIKGTRPLFEEVHNLKRHDVYLKFLAPIETKDMAPEELQALPKRVEELIRSEYEALPALTR